MPLGRLAITDFRGIRRLEIAFGPTTALVGENNCGKTSLLDALEVALEAGAVGPPLLGPDDFHLPQAPGAVPASRLRFLFELDEVAPGAWDEPPWQPLARVARRGEGGRRRLLLELSAERPAGNARSEGTFRFLPAEGPPVVDAEALAAVRRRFPVLRLQLGQACAEQPTPGPMTEAELETTVRRLERRVTDAYRKFSTTWRPHPDELRDALDPVRELARRYDVLLATPHPPNGHTLRSLVETPVPLGAGNPLRPAAAGPGTGAANVALLAALGAFLEARGPGPLPAGAEPVVVLEDAEAHLHPILLASVFRVIERIPAQKVLTTHSGDLLASLPLHAIRRLVRRPDRLAAFAASPGTLSVEDTRRIAFHVRLNRASAVFARCWLLVEGETESWLMPELARLLGTDFPAEGIRCVEFSQCGLAPLLKLARAWGIAWHVLADGDSAGRAYAAAAREALRGDPERMRLTLLREADVEHFLFASGYGDVYRRAAARHRDPGAPPPRRTGVSAVIERALKAAGKPGMALEVVEAAARDGSPGVPRLLVRVIDTVVGLARAAAG